VAKRPNNARALNNLGMVYGEQKRYAEVIALLSQVVELNPKLPEINYNLAFALTHVGRDEDSLKYFQAAIVAAPNNIEAHANFGAALLRLGHIRESIVQNEAALKLDPQRSEVHHNLGLAYAKLGQPEKALGYLRESVRLAPSDSGYLTTLVRTLAENGQSEEAITLCESYLKEHPSVDFFTFLGVLQARRGQLEKARAAFLAALQLDPTNAEARQNLAHANTLLERAAPHTP
jgi:tetratricopeptide (TPR) repeat protein